RGRALPAGGHGLVTGTAVQAGQELGGSARQGAGQLLPDQRALGGEDRFGGQNGVRVIGDRTAGGDGPTASPALDLSRVGAVVDLAVLAYSQDVGGEVSTGPPLRSVRHVSPEHQLDVQVAPLQCGKIGRAHV